MCTPRTRSVLESANIFTKPSGSSIALALEFAINDYNASIRNSRKEFTGGKEGVIRPNKSPEEVIERFFVANRAMFNATKTMKNKINSAKTLGMSEDDIGKTFIDRNELYFVL